MERCFECFKQQLDCWSTYGPTTETCSQVQETQETCHVLQLNGLIKDLVPLVGLHAHGGVVLRQAGRNRSVAGATHLEANPPVAKNQRQQRRSVA